MILLMHHYCVNQLDSQFYVSVIYMHLLLMFYLQLMNLIKY